jgi:hypothetical protein
MIRVLDRVIERHPEFTVDEVIAAWEARVKTQFRLDGEKEHQVAIGVCANGMLIEMIAFSDGDDTVIFRVMKAIKKMLSELDVL